MSNSLRDFVRIAQLEVEPNHIVAYTTREIVNRLMPVRDKYITQQAKEEL